ncbi:MAG: DNA gyrase subunit A, partial [Rhodospirillaceae bacterium]|nr:DNA gyrase subunit A [Rhodospirillaceae bacterium]
QVATEDDDVLLAASGGKSIRFPVADVRVFSGRTSTGVRGIKLKAKDEVISMSIVRHVDFKTEERDAYLKLQSARRRVARGEGEGEGELVTDPVVTDLGQERFDEMEGMEEFILTVTVNGYGKRTSAYEYRIAGRGGQGITNIETSKRNGNVIASFPVTSTDQLIMVTDGGQLIRTTVVDIRIAGRTTQGVTLFKTSKGENVVSVSRLTEDDETEEDEGGDSPKQE